jgi:hypothetical protein
MAEIRQARSEASLYIEGQIMPTGVRQMTVNRMFTVRFAESYFYTGRSEKGPLGVRYPSAGFMMSYPVAVEVAKNLRDLGYGDSVVTTSAGLPATPEDILDADNDPRETEEYSRVWGNDRTILSEKAAAKRGV